ncbi:MAG: hypothetical protein ACYTFI_16440, partial [Planctomycetota bacterium]
MRYLPAIALGLCLGAVAFAGEPGPDLRPDVPPGVPDFGAKLRERIVDAVKEGERPSFYYSRMRTEVVILGVDDSRVLSLKGPRMPVVKAEWSALSLDELKQISLAVLRQGQAEDHAIAAFYLMMTGNAAEAEQHLLLAGEDAGVRDSARFRVNIKHDPLRGFEKDASGWGIESWKDERGLGEPVAAEAERTLDEASEGEWSLEMPVQFPRATVLFKKRSSIGSFRYVTYDVFVPAECPGRVRSVFFAKDKDGLWFQAVSGRPLLRDPDGTYEPGTSATRLVAGRWNTVAVDLRPGRSDFVPEGHLAR